MNAVYDCMDPKLPMLGEVFDMSKTVQKVLDSYLEFVFPTCTKRADESLNSPARLVHDCIFHYKDVQAEGRFV